MNVPYSSNPAIVLLIQHTVRERYLIFNERFVNRCTVEFLLVKRKTPTFKGKSVIRRSAALKVTVVYVVFPIEWYLMCVRNADAQKR